MREADKNRKLFHRAHYNIIAKRFNEALDPYMSPFSDEALDINSEIKAIRASIVGLAIDFALRLHADNEDFDPVMFLNACSPNKEKYPLGELWEEVEIDGN